MGNDQSNDIQEIRFEYTPLFPVILEQLRSTILITTYQARKLLVLGTSNGKLNVSLIDQDQPMGLAVSPSCIAIGTRRQLHFLIPAHQTQVGQDFFDGCFVPRSSFFTGAIQGHELGWGDDGLWIVNTLFSCLATLHEDFSFVPRWRPPFVTTLIDQDRCHLNGMAIVDGKPKFVTAMSETDTPGGWRPTKASSGIVMDVPSSEVICRGLCMPHSPRIYEDRLWILNSGKGELGYIDLESGQLNPVASMPGFTRGLAFNGKFAFVGLSMIRETAVFGGVPIAERRNELCCGVGIIDLSTGKTVAVFQFLSGVSEIFAVEILASFTNPLIAGALLDQKEHEVWIVPAEHSQRPASFKKMPIFASVGNRPDGETNQLTASELLLRYRTLRSSGKFDLSISLIENALEQHPSDPALLVELGNLRQDQGRKYDAVMLYQRAVAAAPNFTSALKNLGYLFFNIGETDKAADVYQRLIDKDSSPINCLLASAVLPVVYDSQHEIDYWRVRQNKIVSDLVARKQTVDATLSLVPPYFFAAYQGLCDRQLMEMRGKVIQGHDFSLKWKKSKRGDKRLRVGFMSAYFKDHTIGRLNIGRIEQLDRTRIHATILSATQSRDELAKRFEKAADTFVALPLELKPAIELLSKLDLDVLLFADVGMDALTSTLAFSRFAPIQAVSWGHPDTTGSPNIDYFLSAKNLEPSNGQDNYTEKLIELPTLGVSYEKPEIDNRRFLSRSDFGLSSKSNIYTCPQSLFKLHPDFDILLGNILQSDPDGEIVLLEAPFKEWTSSLRRRFRRTLPNLDRRIRFLPTLSRDDFLSLLRVSDVVLDPIHFGGGNSSIETLGVGTPLVTLEGKFLRSRITSGLFRQIGLEAMVASNPQSYCEMAIKIATNSKYRGEIKELMGFASDRFFGDHRPAEELSAFLLECGSTLL